MTDLTKDEVSAVAQKAGCAWLHEPLAQRFATLCRAPLVAENEGLKESLESVLSQLKERDAELARVRAGEPFGWYSAKEDDFMLDKIRKTHERLNSHTHRIGKYDLALYTAPPQPAAQEPTSAPPVVEQLVEALEKHHAEATRYSTAKNRANATCAEFKTSPLSELAEQGYMLSLGKETVAAIAAGQQYLKENGNA